MKVSVWAGTTVSWDVLDGHLTFAFTEDGDAIPCRFCAAFGIDWFDEDYREASHSENATRSLHDLLKRHSKGDLITRALEAQPLLVVPCNAIVLLYAFDYKGAIQSAAVTDDTFLFFLGCVDIE